MDLLDGLILAFTFGTLGLFWFVFSKRKKRDWKGPDDRD